MKLLTGALLIPFENGRPSNQVQQLDLHMRADNDPVGYGHALGGYLSSRVTAWLLEQGKRAPEGGDVPVPKEVAAAMREAWVTVCGHHYKRWTRECRGRIASDGRFILECFGDACDLAIYPDQVSRGMERSSVQFGCHNLDTAIQQVTLLAGLAKICELARKAE